MRRRLWQVFIVLAIVSLAIPTLKAQDLASITGTVTDPSGAVIAGAKVELSNSGTSISFEQTTDEIGAYRFLKVPPAAGYKLTFTHEGFATGVISEVPLSVGITRTQNIVLTVGGESQTVAVSAVDENVTLNTTDASIGNNIDVQQLNDLPVYDRTRGITTLFYQQPGVDINQGAVTGARIDQSAVSVDGLDTNDFATGQTFYLTSPAPVDSVQQFTGAVAGLGAGLGTGSGAQFQLVTKNGTNGFHGNFNEYHRDTSTVANTWFNNLTGLPRRPLIRNQFGANIGGPIKKDKLFFFFNWADSRIVQSATTERIVPLPDFRAGSLNYIWNGTGCDDTSRKNTTPNCIKTLTPAQVKSFDPAGIGFSANALSYINSRYPAANDLSQGDGVNTGGYRFSYASPDNNISYVGRIDYNLTSTQKVYGRFTINREDAISEAPMFGTDPLTHPIYDRSYSYVVNHTWDIGKNKVNAFYYGDAISKLSFPDTYNPLGANQPSFSGFDGPFTAFDGQQRRVPVPMVRDDFSWLLHKHTLSLGGTFKWVKTNSNLITNFNFPGIGLQGAALSNGLEGSVRPADLYTAGDAQAAVHDYDKMFASALGVIGQISTNYSYDNKGMALAAGAGTPRAYRFYQTEAYFGDNWKVKPNLTLTYGVRWQYYTVPYEAKGFESVPTAIPLKTFVQDRLAQQNAGNTSNTGLPLFSYKLGGKANNGPNLYQPTLKDFAPRVGFSYSPFRSQKTVINGGAGIIYDRTVINAINFLQDQISYLFFNQSINQFGSGSASASLATDPRVGSNLSYPASLNPAPQPIKVPYTPYVDSTGNLYGLAAGQTNFVISPDLKDPYSIALNFGIQQQLPSNMVLKVNYVRRLGRRLIATSDANQVIDVPDYTHKSTQSMAKAFAGLTTELRAGKDFTNVTAQPWFENVMAAWGPAFGYNSNTAFLADNVHDTIYNGDISDALYTLAFFSNDVVGFGLDGLLPTNIGIPSQFGTNAYLTNQGNSNYHGLLVTLDKNMSYGLRFEFNYTWSHSIDNASVSANDNPLFTNSNMICDILYPRACRANSDFDVRQEFNSNFLYELPFGHGKKYLSTAPGWANQVLGGWGISGQPGYRTGLPVTAYSHAFMASFDNLAPAIFTGNKADLKTSVNVNHTSKTVYQFAGGAAGAKKTLADFRGPIGIEYGSRNIISGPGAFFLDAGLGKEFPIYGDKLKLNFRADAFNLFNHPNFKTGGLSIVDNASQFGQITSTVTSLSGNSSRVAQFSLSLNY